MSGSNLFTGIFANIWDCISWMLRNSMRNTEKKASVIYFIGTFCKNQLFLCCREKSQVQFAFFEFESERLNG